MFVLHSECTNKKGGNTDVKKKCGSSNYRAMASADKCISGSVSFPSRSALSVQLCRLSSIESVTAANGLLCISNPISCWNLCRA